MSTQNRMMRYACVYAHKQCCALLRLQKARQSRMRTRTVVAATAPFVIAVGIATSTRLPPWRAPRVVVGELFRDILSCPVPGLPSGRDAPCPMLDAKERLRRAPWLSREQAASARLPSLADLNATMLSQASLYNPTRTECAGSSARLSLASHEVPGGNLCVHQVLGGLSTLLFDQFTTEALVLQRYLQRWPLCEPRPADEACGADLVADTCGADVVVVPSLVFHSIIASGRRGWFWVRCMRMRSLVKDYWRRLMGRYYTPGRRPGPLIVIIESHTFDTTVIHWLLDELGDLPDEFSSRVLIACYNSNLSRVQRRPFWRPRTSAHLRNSTLAPPEATTIQSGGELELRRRARLLIAAARAHTPPPFHFGGPLIVSIPVPVGMDRGARLAPRLRAICAARAADRAPVARQPKGALGRRAWRSPIYQARHRGRATRRWRALQPGGRPVRAVRARRRCMRPARRRCGPWAQCGGEERVKTTLGGRDASRGGALVALHRAARRHVRPQPHLPRRAGRLCARPHRRWPHGL